MAEAIATGSSRGHRTICLPIAEDASSHALEDPAAFRRSIDDSLRETPEVFPGDFGKGWEVRPRRRSVRQRVPLRRILLKDQTAYSVRPSFLMPSLTAHVEDVEGPLFLRQFGVPFWALTRVFGHDPMSWYRMGC